MFDKLMIHLYSIVSVQVVTILEIQGVTTQKIHRKHVSYSKMNNLVGISYHSEKGLFDMNEHVTCI